MYKQDLTLIPNSKPLSLEESKCIMLIEKLLENKGNLTISLKEVGLNYDYYLKHLKNDELFKDALMEIREQTTDYVEGKLMECIEDKDFKAIKYYLDAHGKDRGYGQPKEVQHVVSGKTFVELIGNDRYCPEIEDGECEDVTGG